MDPGHGPGAVPAPPEILPAPMAYDTISSEFKLADLKLQSTIDSEVFISFPLQWQSEARPTFLWRWETVSYIQLVNISKIPQEQFYGLLRFYRKKWKIKIQHTQHTANLPDFNWVLGKNSLLANYLRYKFFGYWFLEFHELLSLRKIEIQKWRYRRPILPVSHTEMPECTFCWAVVSTGCQGANATYIDHMTVGFVGSFLFHIVGHSWGGQKQVNKKSAYQYAHLRPETNNLKYIRAKSELYIFLAATWL